MSPNFSTTVLSYLSTKVPRSTRRDYGKTKTRRRHGLSKTRGFFYDLTFLLTISSVCTKDGRLFFFRVVIRTSYD